jgi:3-(methylthio)propanoyl-CoA dehydrogenase
MEAGLSDPRDALAAASPYLRMFSLVTAGWLMARQALAAVAALDDAGADTELLHAKIGTARFFCEQVLPGVHGLVAAATASGDALFALDPAGFGG